MDVSISIATCNVLGLPSKMSIVLFAASYARDSCAFF